MNHSARLLALLAVLATGLATAAELPPPTVQNTAAIGSEPISGIIIKARIGGDQSGKANPTPLTTDPKKLADRLNAMGVTLVRVQVNDVLETSTDESQAIREAGKQAIDGLAQAGFHGVALIGGKKWAAWNPRVRKSTGLSRADEWAFQISETYRSLSPAGRRIFGGVSMGESTPSNRDWDRYARGIELMLAKLTARLPTNALKGKLIVVPGCGYNGDFKNFNLAAHLKIAAAVRHCGAKLVYGVKTFYSRQSVLKSRNFKTESEWESFLKHEAGLQQLNDIQKTLQKENATSDNFKVVYLGNAADSVDSGAKRQALEKIWSQFGWHGKIADKLFADGKADLFTRNGANNATVQAAWASLFR